MSFLFLKPIHNADKKSLSLQNPYHKKGLSPIYFQMRKRERTWKIPSFAGAPGRRGSLTIEASLGLTLFLLLMTALCQIFLVMQLQIKVQRALEQLNNEAAQYSYVSSQLTLWESESRLLSELEDYLLTELGKEALRLRFIAIAGEEYLDQSVLSGGAEGISFEESHVMEEENRLHLVVSYQIRLPVAGLGAGIFDVRQQSYRYAWLGDVRPEKEAPPADEEQTVYVTKNSQVYHVSLSCTHLKLSVRQVPLAGVGSLRNDNGAKYYACEHCRPDGSESSVYITGDGTRYHGSRDCGSISRNVTAIPISQAGERRPCSRCGQQ